VSKSKAIKGQKAKQPYAIAMGDGSPFGIGGLRENWRDPTSSEWVRTFAIMAEADWAPRISCMRPYRDASPSSGTYDARMH
jgi:hypothetical protein